MDDLVDWLLFSGTGDDDELLTRRLGPKKRSITRKDFVSAMKAAASWVGLDPGRYSSKSLRGGFATAAAAAGMPSDELNLRGGWAQGSRVPGTFYTTHLGHSRGGMAILDDTTFFTRPTEFEELVASLEHSGR